MNMPILLRIYFIVVSIFPLQVFARSFESVHIGLASNFSEVNTGYTNPYGGYFRDGVQLAFETSKRKLEDKGIQITFDEFDYGTSEARVSEEAKKAVASTVVAVIGYSYSTQALIAAPIHQAGGLPMITPSASAHRVSEFGRFVHQGCMDNVFMGKVLAQVAVEKLKAHSAVLVPAVDCAYCEDLARAFENQFVKLGGKIVANFPVLAGDRNFDSFIRQMKQISFDVVLVPNQELSSARIISALSKSSMNQPFLGGDWWGNTGEGFYGILGDAPSEGYFISHWHPEIPAQESKNFVSKYIKRFHKVPNDTAVLAFDSTALLIRAVLNAKNRSRGGIEDYLNQMTSFNGVTGKFHFHRGSAPEKSLVLMKAHKRKFAMISVITPKMTKK